MFIHFRFDHVSRSALIDAIEQVVRLFCDPIAGFGHLPLIAEKLHKLATPVSDNEIVIDDASITSLNEEIRVAQELAAANVSVELTIEQQLRTTLQGGASPVLQMLAPTFVLSYHVANGGSEDEAFAEVFSANLTLKETTAGWDVRFESDHPNHDEVTVRTAIETLPNCEVYGS